MARHRLLIVAALAAAAIVGPSATAAAPAQVSAEVEVTRSCIIRFYSTGPAVHENTAHACTANVTLDKTTFACFRARDGAHVKPKAGPYVNLNLTWHVVVPAVEP